MTDSDDSQNHKLIRNSTAEFLISTAQGGEASIEARYENETNWLSQRLMGELFDVDVRTVSEHLRNVFNSGELDEKGAIRKFRKVQREGAHEMTRSIDPYNLDAIISVGYRVNSVRATQFLQWAKNVVFNPASQATRNFCSLRPNTRCYLQSEVMLMLSEARSQTDCDLVAPQALEYSISPY